RLRGTPEFDSVADFRREDNSLTPITVAVWGPLVCVHLGNAVPPLEEYLAPLPQRTAGLGLERIHFVERRDYRLACNLKVVVDNFLDGGYHVNTIHPGLAGVLNYSQYRTEIAGQTSVQISPLKPATPKSAGDGMAKVRTGDAAYYWWLFPNFMINIYQGVMDTNLVLPLGVDSCRVIMDFYFTQTEETEAKHFKPQSIEAAHKIQREDIGIGEDVQRALGSRC